MHYGDEYQEKNQKLRIGVYKHKVAGNPVKFNENGLLERETVHYDISSIQECRLFDVGLLYRMIDDPYKYINEAMSKEKFEEWYILEIESPEYDKIRVISIENVSKAPEDWKRLH